MRLKSVKNNWNIFKFTNLSPNRAKTEQSGDAESQILTKDGWSAEDGAFLPYSLFGLRTPAFVFESAFFVFTFTLLLGRVINLQMERSYQLPRYFMNNWIWRVSKSMVLILSLQRVLALKNIHATQTKLKVITLCHTLRITVFSSPNFL